MRDKPFCRTVDCRRALLGSHFNFTVDRTEFVNHLYCDNCAKSCSCDDCAHVNCLEECTVTEQPPSPKIDSTNVDIIEQVLVEYFQFVHSDSKLPHASVCTGLTKSLATYIARDYHQFGTMAQVQAVHSYLTDCALENICSLVHQVLDMDTQ
jgi:hypothetical protein